MQHHTSAAPRLDSECVSRHALDVVPAAQDGMQRNEPHQHETRDIQAGLQPHTSASSRLNSKCVSRHALDVALAAVHDEAGGVGNNVLILQLPTVCCTDDASS